MLSADGALETSDRTALSDAEAETSCVSLREDVSAISEDTVFSSERSERETSFRSPQPVIIAVQSAAHKKTVESFLIFIITVLSHI